MAHTIGETEHVVERVLAGSVRVQLATLLLALYLKVESGASFCSLKMQVLKEMSGARSFESLVARTCSNKDTDGGNGAGMLLLGANSNAVRDGGDFHGALVLEGLRNFTSGKISEVVHKGSLAELEVLLAGFESIFSVGSCALNLGGEVAAIVPGGVSS